MTTLVSRGQLESLRAMAAQLGLELLQEQEPLPGPAGPADLEAAKKGLEDVFNLL